MTGNSSKVKQDHVKRLRIIVTFLNEAHVLGDINFPGSDLHLENDDVYDVDYVDYH